MSGYFRAHRLLAILVLIAAAGWIATGEFAAVGSEEAKAGQPEHAKPGVAVPATSLRTVAAIVPVFVDHSREIRVSGATEADKQAVLAARANGIVAQLGVTPGAVVAADTLVLRLEGADVMAEVATAEASLAEAKQQLEVGETLYARGSLAELELTSRRAARSAAEAALSQAVAAADRLTLKAPFAGLVDSVAVELGEWVQAGSPVVTILALDPIVVKAEVSELDLGHVAVGSAARVRLVNGTEMQGTIRHVSRQASEETRTFVVEVALPNADRHIPAGMTAEVSLFATAEPAVTVPRSALTLSDSGAIGLRVVGADNRARFAPVELVGDTETGMIVSGVPHGVRIITAGQDLVRDGEEVIVAEGAAEGLE